MIATVADGNQAAFAALIGKSRAYVGFWLADPSKPHAKQMGHEAAREIEAEMRRRFGKQYADGWLDTDPESHQAGLDTSMLGVALTSMDQVIRGRGLRMEGQLGRYAPVLAMAYEAALIEFPSGPPSPETRSGKATLRAFDKKVDEWLGGGIANGTIGPLEAVAEGSADGTGARQAKGTKVASGRR